MGLWLLALCPAPGAIAIGIGLILTTGQRWGQLWRRPLTRVWLLLAGGMGLTCGWAANSGEAWLGLFNFLPYFWVVSAGAELLQTPAQARRLAQIAVLGAMPVVVLGLGEMLLGWAVPGFWLGLLPGPALPYGNPPGRMASSFQYANLLACYLGIVFCLGLGLLGASGRSGGAGYGSVSQTALAQNPSPRMTAWIGWAIAVLGLGVGLVLTQSRSAWGIALGASLGFALYRGWWMLPVAIAALAGTILWAAFGSVGRDPLRAFVPRYFWARLTDDLFPNRPVATLRTSQWQFAWDLIEYRPWQGWGLRNFSGLYEAQTQTWMGHPHNLFLMLGAEIGLPLTIVLVSLVGWILFQGFYRSFNPSCLGDRSDQCVFISILLAFLATMTFHSFDVPLFDLRINLMGWLLLSTVLGVVYSSNAGNMKLRR